MHEIIETLSGDRQQHIDRLVEWLRIPSISTDRQRKGDVRRAGEWILEELATSGFDARLDETEGPPRSSSMVTTMSSPPNRWNSGDTVPSSRPSKVMI